LAAVYHVKLHYFLRVPCLIHGPGHVRHRPANNLGTSFQRIMNFVFQSVLVGLVAALLLLVLRPDILDSYRTGAVLNGETPAAERHSSITGPTSYHLAVDRAAPAVVNVLSTRIYEARMNPLLQDPLLREFFGAWEDRPTTRRDSNYGSGVIINEQGYILTNMHLVDEADEIQITLRDGRQVSASVIGTDPDTDLAILKIELDDLPSIRLADPGRLRVGDVVLAIGNPYGFGQTVTQGIVSATGRKRLGITTFEDFIQTDAAINPGNSGGALVNAQGELIGINTAIITQTGGSQGIGLATPVNIATEVMEQIIRHGHVTRGWLGIEAQIIHPDAVPPEIADGGVLVAGTMSSGPADDAGIQPGDIIISINGQSVHDPEQAIRLITGITPGTIIEIEVLRGWEIMAFNPQVAERPQFMRR
jgi:serine protease DegS